MYDTVDENGSGEEGKYFSSCISMVSPSPCSLPAPRTRVISTGN